MRPLFASYSYFAREPFGISTKTSTVRVVGRAFGGTYPPLQRGRDHEGDLSLRALRSIPSGHLARRPAHDLLVHLRELARDGHARVRRHGSDVGERRGDAVRALVRDDGPPLREQRREAPPPLAALLREEAEERELARRKARRDERRDDRARSGDADDLVTGVDRSTYERFARVRERRRARIRHERDVPGAVQLSDEDRDLAPVVELVVRGEVLRPDVVPPQQDLGMPRVLAGDHVDLLQDPERTGRDVLEVADRGRDEIELSHRRGILPSWTRRHGCPGSSPDWRSSSGGASCRGGCFRAVSGREPPRRSTRRSCPRSCSPRSPIWAASAWPRWSTRPSGSRSATPSRCSRSAARYSSTGSGRADASRASVRQPR